MMVSKAGLTQRFTFKVLEEYLFSFFIDSKYILNTLLGEIESDHWKYLHLLQCRTCPLYVDVVPDFIRSPHYVCEATIGVRREW